MVETPEVCDTHRFDQTGRCKECGLYRNRAGNTGFSGGAGSRRQPLSDEDYRRERRKLERTFSEGDD